MPTLNEIINDLNVSIADMETLISVTNKTDRVHISRALGQLKAARGCLVVLIKQEASNVSR